MGHTLRTRGLGGIEESSLRGAATSRGPRYDKSHPGVGPAREADTAALIERRQLEFLGQFSTKHADALRRQRTADSDASREHRLLDWCAEFSSTSESRQRKLLETESPSDRAAPAGEQFTRALRESREWDASKHPRGGYPENRGWWSPAEGGGSGKSEALLRDLDKTGLITTWDVEAVPGRDESKPLDTRRLLAGSPPTGKGRPGKGQLPKFDFDDFYGPSELRGKWLGEGRNRTFQFENPIKIEATGELIHEVKFIDNAPVLDVHALSDKTATIIITGDRETDIRNAEKAWKRLHPNQSLPSNATFHHDLLHTRPVTITIKGKPTKVLVGKMPLVPRELHSALSHQGSASVAKNFYRAAGTEISEVKKLAANRSKGKSILKKVAKSLKRAGVPRSIRDFVGRPIKRIVPIVGTAVGIIEFKQNAEAHGVPGAIARATPVLGDVIGAYDLGSEIAKEITDQANAKADANQAAHDELVDQAWQTANEQMLDAFHEFAPQIAVTNSDGGVDVDEILEAMMIYRSRMQGANLLKAEQPGKFDYDAVAAELKQQFKERLIKASQRTGFVPQGPAT